jgi:hypothetical protein
VAKCEVKKKVEAAFVEIKCKKISSKKKILDGKNTGQEESSDYT